MTNLYVHLTKDQRDTIEYLINKGENFTYIANAINVDRTTISKEIRRNRNIKGCGFSDFSENGISRALNSCEKLNKPPYCCNNCKNKRYCSLHLYYNAKKAQTHYEINISDSKKGIDITKEDIDLINSNIAPLIKNKKQSVNQVYINHPDILYMSKPTFYKYVNIRAISLSDFDLPRKVKYKPRKKSKDKIYGKQYALLIGRTYEDYVIKTYENKQLKIWQLDTVIGKITDNKVLMTFLLVETNFMIIRLLPKKNVASVNKEFDKLKYNLRIDYYKEIINIILTDNGAEFYDPFHMELDYKTGEKISEVYYCHPDSPEEKPELESNHKYIRYYLPKSTSFENLNERQVKAIEDNINNIPRDIFGGKTPYELTNEKYPDLIQKLDAKYIEPDEVTLNPDDIFNNNL